MMVVFDGYSFKEQTQVEKMQKYVSANFRIFQKLAEILLTDGDHECQFDALI